MSEVLIVDDDHNFRETLRELLSDAGYQTLVATNAEEAITLLQTTTPDLTLCDWKMPGGGGEQFLKSLQSEGRTMPVIILTAHGTGPNAMQAMQLGAYDFITKPLDIDQALATVARAIRHMELQREVELLRQQRFRDRSVEDISGSEEGLKPQLIGKSPAWIEIFKNIGRVAATDVGVLLLGESGTGKEVVARTIHENSARSGCPFIILNCAALPPDLLESELFGHERGAFTGAIVQKRGKFEAADGGTIFLDEIGELPLSLQPKLLRVLQEHTFERVGEQPLFMLMSGSSLRRTVHWKMTWSRRPFAPTCSIVLMLLRSASHRCASVSPTYSHWPSIFLPATPNAIRSPRSDLPPMPSWPCKVISSQAMCESWSI